MFLTSFHAEIYEITMTLFKASIKENPLAREIHDVFW